MKRTILFLVCLMGMTFAFAQSSLQDVVYLKNGSIIRGDIIEMVPDGAVKIMTSEGSVLLYDCAEVEKFAKEQARIRKKSPWVAGALSLFTPGLGQFYNGEFRKGTVDFLTNVGGWATASAGSYLIESYTYREWNYVEGEGYYSLDGEVFIEGNKMFLHNSKFLQATGVALFVAGAITIYVNYIHSVYDAAKSSNRINAENGYVMYQLSDHCAFGMQPSIAYERPQYLQGSKPELTAGMNFKLTF